MFTPDIDKVTLVKRGLEERKIEYCDPFLNNFPASVDVFHRVIFFTGYPAGFRETWTDISVPTNLRWVFTQFTNLPPDPDPTFRVTPLGTVMGRFSFREKVGTNSSRNVTTVNIPDRKLRESARRNGFDGKILEVSSSPAQRLIQIFPCPNPNLMVTLARYEEEFISGKARFNFWYDMILRNPLGDTDKIRDLFLPEIETPKLHEITTTATERALFLFNPSLLAEERRQKITQV